MKSSRDRKQACSDLLFLFPWVLAATVSASSQAATVVEPSINTRASYSDSAGDGNRDDSEFLLEVTPSIRLARDSGALTGGLAASLRNVEYLDASDRSTSFVTFRGNGQFEAVKDTFFLEAGGSVSREDRSLFSAQGNSDTFATSASAETRFFSIAPRLEFRLGRSGSGLIRFEQRWADGGGVADRRRDQIWTLQLDDDQAFGRLGWFGSFDRTSTSYDSGVRGVTRESGRLGLSYVVTPRLSLRATLGRESNDYQLSGKERKTTYGFGGNWHPTTRTSLNAFVEERLYGRGYDVTFRHRARRSVWSLSYTRDYTSSSSLVSTSVNSELYTFFYDLFAAQFPDPVQRDAVTRAFLSASGFDNVSRDVTYVSNVQSLRKALRASVVLQGVRNALSLTVYRTEDEQLTPDLVSAGDDFSGNSVIKSTGGSIALSHDLTPKSVLTSSILYSDTQGRGDSARSQKLTTFNAGVSRRFGARSNGSVTYSHIKRGGDVSGDENRLTATFGIRF